VGCNTLVYGSKARNLSGQLSLSQTSKNTMMPCLSYYVLHFSLQQNQRTGGRNRFCLEVGGGGGRDVAQTMYTYVSKCKNDKIFKKKSK
jgi:hypothetical protein